MKSEERTDRPLRLAVSACLLVLSLNVGMATAAPGGQEKVTICHKGQTITVAAPAVKAHLGHGDALGPCPTACDCPTIHDPVICANGKTYGNLCLATCAGQSECQSTCACSDIYDPVLGADGNTYGNRCLAECAEHTECRTTCACPDIRDPMVCTDGNTYLNPCFAHCFGQTECRPTTCVCSRIQDPVSCADGNLYANPCLAECVGQSDCYQTPACSKIVNPTICEDGTIYKNACVAEGCGAVGCRPCVCSNAYDPVRCASGDTYANLCLAQCAGQTECQSMFSCPGIEDPVICEDGNIHRNPCVAQCTGQAECRPCSCSDVHDPVRCADGKTYDNLCVATCAGQTECRAACACTPLYDPVMCADGNAYANPCVASCMGQISCTYPEGCSRIHDPVICADGQTYDNACVAEQGGQADCRSSCDCPDAYDPVECGGDTYGNQCLARCATPNWCEACACPQVVEPVTCGDGSTYANDCVARCHGVVDCQPCGCPTILDPVACTGGYSFDNVCVAECAGHTECWTSCACSEIYDPVTCADGRTWANLCLAQCFHKTGCRPKCSCPGEYDPVACADGNTYANLCLAQCVGQTECSTGSGSPVPTTGQANCWDLWGVPIECAGTGQDGELGSGVAIDPRFIDNRDGTVTDNLTGLIWLQKADCFREQTWAEALDRSNELASGACALTDGSVAGDWRLPNVVELLSLVDYGHAYPSLAPGNPFRGVQSEYYWSSTTVSSASLWNDPQYKRIVGFDIGNDTIDYFSPINHAWPIRDRKVAFSGVVHPDRGARRAVESDRTVGFDLATWHEAEASKGPPAEGGQSESARVPSPLPKTGQIRCWDSRGTPIDCSGTGQDGEYQGGVSVAPRFTDRGDGTVTDNLTGLVWLQNANCFGRRPWDDALALARGLASGSCGLADGSIAGAWRLPNVRELKSLIDYGQFEPALSEGHPFFGIETRDGDYWSSTTYASMPGSAWFVYLFNGWTFGPWFDKPHGNFVWPVRDAR